MVGDVGLHALGVFVDRLGPAASLSCGVRWAGERAPVHGRGKVLTQAMLMLAGGGEAWADIEYLRAEEGLFGAVASAPTLYRTVRALDPATVEDLWAAQAAVRRPLGAPLRRRRPAAATTTPTGDRTGDRRRVTAHPAGVRRPTRHRVSHQRAADLVALVQRRRCALHRSVLLLAPVIMTGTVHRPMELAVPVGSPLRPCGQPCRWIGAAGSTAGGGLSSPVFGGGWMTVFGVSLFGAGDLLGIS